MRGFPFTGANNSKKHFFRLLFSRRSELMGLSAENWKNVFFPSRFCLIFLSKNPILKLLKVVFFLPTYCFFAFLFKKLIDWKGRKYLVKYCTLVLVKVPNAWGDESAHPGLGKWNVFSLRKRIKKTIIEKVTKNIKVGRGLIWKEFYARGTVILHCFLIERKKQNNNSIYTPRTCVFLVVLDKTHVLQDPLPTTDMRFSFTPDITACSN